MIDGSSDLAPIDTERPFAVLYDDPEFLARGEQDVTYTRR